MTTLRFFLHHSFLKFFALYVLSLGLFFKASASDIPKEDQKPYTILSIDGGGVKGIVPALMLKELEGRTGQSVVDLFDMVAGTSIGGILGLYLTTPNANGDFPKYSAAEAVDMFDNHASDIFSNTWWWRFTTAWGYAGPKYDPSNLEKLLQSKLTQRTYFRNSLVDTLITSFDTERYQPTLFKSWEIAEGSDADLLSWEVGRATSAAPTFFPPSQVRKNGNYYSYIDGGTIVNNPAITAYIEAKKRFPQRKIALVSLGTGSAIRNISYDESKGWGPLGWVNPVIDIEISGGADLAHSQAEELCKSNGDCYLRLQTNLKPEEVDLDNVTPFNLRRLRIEAEKTIKENQDRINSMGRILLGLDEEEDRF